MGLLSIFQRKKTAADSPAPGRGAGKSRPAARQAPAASAVPPVETAEAVREARARARRRLMGATVLLLVGVIGFPLLFETQPRPIPVDLPIEIPSRIGAPPLEGGAPPAAAARAGHGLPGAAASALGGALAASGPAPESVSYDARPSAPLPPASTATEVRAAAAAPATQVAQAQPASAASRPPAAAASRPAAAASKPAVVPAPRPAPAVAAASKPAPPRSAQATEPTTASASSTAAAAALLNVPEPASGANRYIVQVAAFMPSEDEKLRELRGKVEKLGLKTYTQAVDTPGGKWIRVRVGPFPTKAEADKVVAKIVAAGFGIQPKVYSL